MSLFIVTGNTCTLSYFPIPQQPSVACLGGQGNKGKVEKVSEQPAYNEDLPLENIWKGSRKLGIEFLARSIYFNAIEI